MSSLQWQRVIGGLSGCSAVGASAYGAHGLKPSKESFGRTFDSGSRLQLLHSVLLMATPSICGRSNPRMATISGVFLTAGMAMFSGSCYAVGVTEDRAYGKAAPVGGLALMAGWISLALVRR